MWYRQFLTLDHYDFCKQTHWSWNWNHDRIIHESGCWKWIQSFIEWSSKTNDIIQCEMALSPTIEWGSKKKKYRRSMSTGNRITWVWLGRRNRYTWKEQLNKEQGRGEGNRKRELEGVVTYYMVYLLRRLVYERRVYLWDLLDSLRR